MATINNIKKRANDIKNAYEPESVTAENVGGLFGDIANVLEGAIIEAGAAQQASEQAAGYLSQLEEAIENLPDGQAVTEQVAVNTVAIEELATLTGGTTVDASFSVAENEAYRGDVGDTPIAVGNTAYAVSTPIVVHRGDTIRLKCGLADNYSAIIECDSQGNLSKILAKSSASSSTTMVEYLLSFNADTYVCVCYRLNYLEYCKIGKANVSSLLRQDLTTAETQIGSLATATVANSAKIQTKIDTDLIFSQNDFRFYQGAINSSGVITDNMKRVYSEPIVQDMDFTCIEGIKIRAIIYYNADTVVSYNGTLRDSYNVRLSANSATSFRFVLCNTSDGETFNDISPTDAPFFVATSANESVVSNINGVKQSVASLIDYVGFPFLTDLPQEVKDMQSAISIFPQEGDYLVTIKWEEENLTSVGISVYNPNSGIYSRVNFTNGSTQKVVYLGKQAFFRLVADNVKYEGTAILLITAQTESEIAKKGNIDRTKSILLGCGFYAGWDKEAMYGNKNNYSDKAYHNSSIYNSNYPDWREYVRVTYGKTPPKNVSFSCYFAGQNVTYTDDNNETIDLSVVPQRVPAKFPLIAKASYSGASDAQKYEWNHESVECLEGQIDLAAEYGVDFFNFVFVPSGSSYGDDPDNAGYKKYVENISVFNQDGSFISGADTILRQSSMNTEVYRYLSCANKYKVKMMLFVKCTDIDTPEKMRTLIVYLHETFINSNPDYLRINGRPLLSLYGLTAFDGLSNALSYGNTIYSLETITLNNEYGNISWGASAYGTDYEGLTDNVATINKSFKVGKMNVFLAQCGRGDAAQYDFTRHPLSDDIPLPTKQELKAHLIDVADKNIGVSDNLIISMYAWNEYTEGGFLMPCKCDGSADGYYNMYRLEAFKEAKEEILSKYVR